MKKIVSLLIFLVAAYSVQSQNRVVTTGVPFLLITADAKSAGIGEQGVATSPDAFSQNWNPSKYAFAPNDSGLGISYTPYLSQLVNDIFLGNVTYYRTISDRAAWSASLKYFSLGEIEIGQIPDDFINPLIERPNEFVLDVGYALKLSDYFSMAVTGAFVNSDLKLDSGNSDASAASTVAFGVSGFYQSDEIPYSEYSGQWRAGFNLSNMGPKLSYDDEGQSDYLPTNLKIGGSFDFIFDSYNKLAVSLEINKLLVPTPSEPVENAEGDIIGYEQPDVSFISGMFRSFGDAPDGFSEELKEFTWSLGAEFSYDDSFALRAGYFNESLDKGGRKFLTLGAGFEYNVVDIDLSYLISATKNINPLENTLRFSLTFNLGEERY
ncbi:MAG: type IX secretion system outer membrane channel protein PorV [Flavobacteriaceae bacterium]|nr:type IX secretion system outer membrane channel protein PorV [Flavobacteriaceae bacterium]